MVTQITLTQTIRDFDCHAGYWAEISFVKTDNKLLLRRRSDNEYKTSIKDKFANDYWVQMAVVIIVLAIIIEIAARHIW